MNTCTRRTEFAKQSTVALALWVSISRNSFADRLKNTHSSIVVWLSGVVGAVLVTLQPQVSKTYLFAFPF